MTIFLLNNSATTHNLRFESFARLEAAGLAVERGNYEQIYTAALSSATTPENIFQQFNVNRPDDFTGHSLSVSDIIVTNRSGEEAAFYVDSAGFKDVTREFLQRENPLKTAEMTSEQNLNMIDGIMNNSAEKPLSVADLERQAQPGRPINLTDLADAVKREKTAPQRAKKQTIQGKLKAGKKQLANERNAPQKAAKRENLEVKMNENKNFTVEETNFIAVFAEDGGDKHEVIAAIKAAMPLIEPEMAALATACVKKLDLMAEDEFYEMDFDLVGVAGEME